MAVHDCGIKIEMVEDNRQTIINQAHEVVKAAGTASAFDALYDAGMLVGVK